MVSYLLTDLTTFEEMGLDKKAVIADAAAWLASQPEPPAHVVPLLKERFGLTSLQACEAIALARNTAGAKQEGAT